jgi:hypothetical protein
VQGTTHCAYTVIFAVTVVDAVNAEPPFAAIVQPVNIYPERVGAAGSVPTVVAGYSTVFTAGLASVSPPLLSKVTVYSAPRRRSQSKPPPQPAQKRYTMRAILMMILKTGYLRISALLLHSERFFLNVPLAALRGNICLR